MREYRGGLDVNDLVSIGGVRLGSDPWPIEESALLRTELLEAWDSSGPVEMRQSSSHEGENLMVPTWPGECRPRSHGEGRVILNCNGTFARVSY